MPLMRLLGISLLSFLLTACGGGGSLEKDGSISDGDSTTETSTYTISLKGYLKASDTESNSVTADAPLELRASLVNEDGDAVSGERITFTLADSIGLLDPVSGTVLTNTDGEASITLTAGDTAGAGIITATYINGEDTYSDSFGFASDGSENDDSSISGSIELDISILDITGSPFTAENPVSKDNKGTVTATLLDEDENLQGQLISFTTK